MKKWMKRLLFALSISLLLLVLTVFLTWGNEISSFNSIKKVKQRDDSKKAGDVYMMHVKGGFYLDEFVKQGGVKSDKELIQFVTNKITKGLIPLQIEESEIACSAFQVETTSGNHLFARNYDLDKTNSLIVYTEASEGRHASVSSVDLKFLGVDVNADSLTFKNKMSILAAPYAPLDGMNDVGVSIGIFMTYQGKDTVATNQNTDKPDITSTTLIRLVLDYADDLGEAIEIAQNYDMHDSAKTSYHFMVADKSGRSAILEWINGEDVTDNDGSARKLVVTYNNQDQHIGVNEAKLNAQWVTNFIIEPNYYQSNEEKRGYDRYLKLEEELVNRKGIVEDEQEAMDILAMVGRRKGFKGDPDTVTAHSVVYNLDQLTATWISNEQFNQEDAIFYLSLQK